MEAGQAQRRWHGITFERPVYEIQALLWAFSATAHPKFVRKGWNLSRPEMFWKIAEYYWPKKPGTKIYAERHPWAEQMIDAACEWNLLGVSGCASSGKSFTLGALWSIVSWLASPRDTIVLVTSTTIQGSRKRVWKDICRLMQAAGGEGMSNINPAVKVLDATAQVKIDAKILASYNKSKGIEGEPVVAAGAGIEIVAGEPSKTAEANTKLQGLKSKHVILVGDEFPHLGIGILETALGNLTSNAHFQIIALGNFASRYDPFGVFTEPRDGWKTVTEDTEGWETKLGGYCIRFDGEQSPNVLAGEDLYEGVYSNRLYQRHLTFGRSSPTFWKMCKAFPMPEGSELSIYSENDFIAGDVHNKNVVWDELPAKVAFLDPAFTNGGDRSQAVVAEVGMSNGAKRLKFIEEKELVSNVMEKAVPHDFQIARLFKKFCEQHGVKPENAGFDNTGAGISFGSILHQEFSPKMLPICFGGAASDEPVSLVDDEKCSDRYFNRVSELWVQGREYVRSGQIKGLSHEAAKELLARRFPDPAVTKISLKKVKVEGKDEMKGRIGFSPDLADALLGCVEVARQRLGFIAAGYGTAIPKRKQETLEQNAVEEERIWSDDSFLGE